jgi:hypothetical protein
MDLVAECGQPEPEIIPANMVHGIDQKDVE